MACRISLVAILAAVLCCGTSLPTVAGEQEAIDGCIDKLRSAGGPDGQSGTVLSSEFSQAATQVMLRDSGGSVWKCLANADGSVSEISVVDAADDGSGSMDGGSISGDNTGTERVKFAAGATGAEIDGRLPPGNSLRYVLGAKKNQFLNVGVSAENGVEYQIFNPDGTFLLEQMPASKRYRGQLWQSGDHVVEVINRGKAEAVFTVNVSIE